MAVQDRPRSILDGEEYSLDEQIENTQPIGNNELRMLLEEQLEDTQDQIEELVGLLLGLCGEVIRTGLAISSTCYSMFWVVDSNIIGVELSHSDLMMMVSMAAPVSRKVMELVYDGSDESLQLLEGDKPQENQSFSTTKMLAFYLGVACAVLGVKWLSSDLMQQDVHDDSELIHKYLLASFVGDLTVRTIEAASVHASSVVGFFGNYANKAIELVSNTFSPAPRMHQD